MKGAKQSIRILTPVGQDLLERLVEPAVTARLLSARCAALVAVQ